MIVVDASVLASALGDDGPHGIEARARLGQETLFAPELIDLEVASAWRRAVRDGRLDDRRSDQALRDLTDLPMGRAPHRPLMPRIWELRDNLTTYDAAYVALAEALESTLLTADRHLARASGPKCHVELVRPRAS